MEMEMKAHKRNILQEPSVSVLSLVSLSNTKNERDEELDKHKPFLPANRVLDICLYFSWDFTNLPFQPM